MATVRDGSATNLSGSATFPHPQRQQGQDRDFSERIPLSLSVVKQSGRVESDDGSDTDIRKRKRGPESDGLDAKSPTSLSVPRVVNPDLDDIVWPHGPLLGYEVRDGKPVVLVPWHPTWEPLDEYSMEEVE